MKLADERTIGGRIRNARQTQNLKAKELASEIGITPNYMSMVEQGARTPSDELLGKIAERTGVSFEWLKDGKSQPDTSGQVENSAPVPSIVNSYPDPQLFLLVLKWQRPDLFPDTVGAILDINSDTLDGLLEGKVGYDPRWRPAFEVLAQRMSRSVIQKAFNGLDAFLERLEQADMPLDISAVIRRYLDDSNASAYKLTEQAAEKRELDAATLELHTLTFKAESKAPWRFTVVEATYDPKLCGDLLAQMDGAEIIREQLDYAAFGQVYLLFRDVALYNQFEKCAGKVQAEAEESGHIPDGAENLTLLLIEGNEVTDCTPLYRE